MSTYFTHQFKHEINEEERSVVLLGFKNVDKWVAAVELRGEAKKLITPDDRELIANYINTLIIKRRSESENKLIVVSPIVGLIDRKKR